MGKLGLFYVENGLPSQNNLKSLNSFIMFHSLPLIVIKYLQCISIYTFVTFNKINR